MSTLASDTPFFKTGTTTACFMGAGNTIDDSEVLMIRANRGESASMWCFTSDVGSGSTSHDVFVADASSIFIPHPKVTRVVIITTIIVTIVIFIVIIVFP